MRDRHEVEFAADAAYKLAWYARSRNAGYAKTETVEDDAEKRVESQYPKQMEIRFWEDPYLMGRMEGVMAALRWAQHDEDYEGDPEMPSVFGSGYDT